MKKRRLVASNETRAFNSSMQPANRNRGADSTNIIIITLDFLPKFTIIIIFKHTHTTTHTSKHRT